MQTYDEKPKRRLLELLQSQGLQPNQQVVFLSDGGEDVRSVQLYLHPEAEHLLDWFHVTMRLTVLKQIAKGLPEKVGEADDQYELRPRVLKDLESLKWYLWHGNVFEALDELQGLEMILDSATFETKNESARKLLKGVEELHTYVVRNQALIPNCGERYRNGERIASGFVESAVNQVISKRMVKQPQMGWRAWCPSLTPDPNAGAQRGMGKYVSELVPGIPSEGRSGDPQCRLTPQILPLSLTGLRGRPSYKDGTRGSSSWLGEYLH